MQGLPGQVHPTEPQMANLAQLGVRETRAHKHGEKGGGEGGGEHKPKLNLKQTSGLKAYFGKASQSFLTTMCLSHSMTVRHPLKCNALSIVIIESLRLEKTSGIS